MLNGIINVYKEAGYTSHDVVARLRGIAGQRKIGHTGTLDPDAVGVLPVCLGKATKLCSLLTDENKTYETVLLLGRVTDTQDISGTVLGEHVVDRTEDEVSAVIEGFQGEQMQVPPMYSALKRNGRKLYELAREGITVEREPRPVHFYEIRILKMELPRVKIRITCSRGTYIRTFCHDVGEKLGCGGCMESLVRTKVADFTIQDAVTLAELQRKKEEGTFRECIIPVDRMFENCPALTADIGEDQALHNGNPVGWEGISRAGRETPDPAELYRVYDSRGIFIGIFRYLPEKNLLKPETMFFDPEELEQK